MGGRPQARGEFMLAGNSQPALIQGVGVLRTPDQSIDLSHPRQMRGVQTADCAASDNANFFHARRILYLSFAICYFSLVTYLAERCHLLLFQRVAMRERCCPHYCA